MKNFKIIIISNILIFLLACDKNEDIIFQKGSIVGFVELLDETGIEIEDKGGVYVLIKGLNNSSNTDENGRFELTNVPAGTYNLVYKKDGYGIYKSFGYQFIGGSVPALLNETTLYEQPNIEIQSLYISFDDNVISISGEIPETNRFSVQTFINDIPDVSHENYDYTTDKSNYYGREFTHFSQSVNLSETPYSFGDKVYLAIYFMNLYEKRGYFDYEKEMYVYSSYKKASDAISFIIE